ncbi:P-loop containing nucleoside triphosphate hydrolase protein [Dendrothele bispora CBS 962.96]|uniref:P-loop containing nucleoside triphosphate hydrolase protein n=1 Tax=Dendrothele bispora (strain CBS 962.96) TaxID=1314807 RepID=A0A4S8KZM4_DENBC|nr:P-loop containing nucleoside triphosphate hydrolase protein [Dendrothele bispora CBS 962.96]
MISDVIRGKGGGLVCVLHGPPGTGKTLTAEAVAELLRRPLYIAGATELTTDPSELEKKMKQILNLATAWDAVVLIDEADVFLEQRSLNELDRNTLVSAVLRLLEYHRGVLFLTTNRIKSFDHAFMSRISIAIKYPELDHAGRFAIWSKFFALAGHEVKDSNDPFAEPSIFTRAIVEELASKPFNGRTIKNLVRTAQALALASNSPLTLEHINIVVESQEKFLDEFAGMKI